MKKRDISRFYPPGYNYSDWNSYMVLVLVALAIANLVRYATRFDQAFSLIYKDFQHQIFDPNKKMELFGDLIPGNMAAFWILLVYCVLWALSIRSYFTRYSNSIYIMKRLESRRELWIRCTAGPLALALMGLALCLLMTAIFRLHYNAAVPAECMQPQPGLSLKDLINAFLP